METMKKSMKNTYVTFAGFTIFAAIFAAIYEFFSHDVFSKAMVFAFAYPLLLGFVPFFVFYKTEKNIPSDFSRLSYSFGVITMMVGSIFLGVLEIYGTTNKHHVIYYYVAGILLFVGIASWCYTIIKNKKMERKNG